MLHAKEKVAITPRCRPKKKRSRQNACSTKIQYQSLYAFAGSAAAAALVSCCFTILLRAARSFKNVFASR